MKKHFKATIYKTGINWCVDVPSEISETMKPEKGYIRVKGTINGFEFSKSLVPIKNGPYRLFVNMTMMKGGNTALDKVASFVIEQETEKNAKEYPVPDALLSQLEQNNLTGAFNQLAPSRKKDLLKYLNYIKTEGTLNKNISKLIYQLQQNISNVRLP